MEHSSILAMSLAVMQILKIFLDMVYIPTLAFVVDTCFHLFFALGL
jgi:hypothetical protein